MNFERARFNMVEQQVRTWEVLDSKVLGLMESVHREDFVPVRYRKLAFADLSIPLAMGQSMMCPRVEGRMLQSLDIQEDDSVLEIGTGSGFITACLSILARRVVSVELFEELFLDAEIRLRDKHARLTRSAVRSVTTEPPAGRSRRRWTGRARRASRCARGHRSA